MTDIDATRTVPLNDADEHDGDCVIYVMSRDQRVRDNFALLAAQNYAREREVPLRVLFNVYPQVKNRVANQYAFMFDGLEEVERDLDAHDITFEVMVGDAVKNIRAACQDYDAAAIFFDFSPLRGPSAVRAKVAKAVRVPCFVTDTHNVVPVWVASDKQEWAARTLRTKIHKQIGTYLHEPPKLTKHPHAPKQHPQNNWKQIRAAVKAPMLDEYTPVVKAGERAARANLRQFVKQRLETYDAERNDPNEDALSLVSAHLHFGQIASLRVALDVTEAVKGSRSEGLGQAVDAYLEELTVRKELSDNYCFYCRQYDDFEGLPDWARKTLDKHADDEREHRYSLERLEAAHTDDAAWNAAQIQMMRTGKMHGYMRMYWAKKILEWTPDAQTALHHTIYLNDTYSLDGYDPNGYANILWSIGGLHDRPWKQRPIYGTVRYMSTDGLRRKFDLDAYIAAWTDDEQPTTDGKRARKKKANDS